MTVDERVRTALVEIADDVRPAPDPYGRLHARHRRVRRRRAAVAGATLALVAVVATTLPMLPDRAGPTVTVDPPGSFQEWAERLRHTPVRGAVGAAEPAYVAALTKRLTDLQRAGAFRVTQPVSEVNVLYLDDIGSARVAFVAFHLTTPDPISTWENASGWFVARPGASVEELSDPVSAANVGDGLHPFEARSYLGSADGIADGAAVGLAPAGCVVETAPLPTVDAWTPEPTGSYVVRTPGTQRPEWWRVVCAGVVKEVRTADPGGAAEPLTETQLDAALRGARGQVDRRLARDAVGAMAASTNYVTGPVRVLWGGRITGARDDANGSLNGDAVLVTAPWAPNGWQLRLDITYEKSAPDGPTATGVGGWTPDDPTGPGIVVPIRLGQSSSVLVVVPDGATTVRAVRDHGVFMIGGPRRVVVDTANVTGSAAVVDAADSPFLVFEALDGDGTILATAELPAERNVDPEIVPW